MASSINEVTIISVSAVGTNLVNSIFSTTTKNTLRIVEIFGGFATSQFAKSSSTKAAGVGILTGALVDIVSGVFKTYGTGYYSPKSRSYYTNYTKNPIDFGNSARNINYCSKCNQR